MDFLTQFFAVLSEQLHLRLFRPGMRLRTRFAWSLLVAPAIALASYFDEGKWVSASMIGQWFLVGFVVTYLVHLADVWRRSNAAKQAEKKLRQTSEEAND